VTAARTPAACSVLTPALAQEAVRQPVAAPKFVQENPDLGYCAYATRTRSPGGSRGVSVSVGSAEVIEQLISWQAPRISGLGDEAHGADASDGLAVRQGKLGLEVTVDLGQSASNAENLAAEEALARRLLGRLPG
jgi:hypothetical protein